MFFSKLFFVSVLFYHCLFVYASGDGWATRSDSQKLRQLRKSTRVTKTPCSCNEDTATCTCCASFAGEKGCASFKVPDGRTRNQMVRYNFNFNDQSTSMMSPADVNPPPLCVSVLGGLIARACAVFEASVINGQYFQACAVIRATFATIATLEADLDCAQLYISPFNNPVVYNNYNYADDSDYGINDIVIIGNQHKSARSENGHEKQKNPSHPCNK